MITGINALKLGWKQLPILVFFVFNALRAWRASWLYAGLHWQFLWPYQRKRELDGRIFFQPQFRWSRLHAGARVLGGCTHRVTAMFLSQNLKASSDS